MRYLILDADYMSTGIKDEFAGFLDQEDLGVSDELWSDISKWVRSYGAITMMSPDERVSPESIRLIDNLDNEGLQFIERLTDEIKSEVKIRYFSEGKLCYLS
jgi:hypothetical protein